MRIRQLVVGLSAVIAVASIAACSSGTTNSAAGPQVAEAADMASQTTTTTVAPPPTTTTTRPTTTVPTTTTTTHPPVTRQKTTPQDAAVVTPGVPCSARAVACADLSAHKAWLLRNGKVIYGPVTIASGRTGWPTPVGTFHVEFKNAHYFSHEFQVPMPDAVFFQPGIAFHLGSTSVRSHGCIHLSRSAALTFFHTLQVGDVVQVVR